MHKDDKEEAGGRHIQEEESGMAAALVLYCATSGVKWQELAWHTHTNSHAPFSCELFTTESGTVWYQKGSQYAAVSRKSSKHTVLPPWITAQEKRVAHRPRLLSQMLAHLSTFVCTTLVSGPHSLGTHDSRHSLACSYYQVVLASKPYLTLFALISF